MDLTGGISLSLMAGAVWVLLSTLVAFLPMRFQRRYGLGLLLVAPVLIWLLGRDYGPWVAGFALFAFLSMFRRPLIYLCRRALGHEVQLPSEEARR